jgi:hypothetical protein
MRLREIALVFDEMDPDLDKLHFDCKGRGLVSRSVWTIKFWTSSRVVQFDIILLLKWGKFGVFADFFALTGAK